MDALPFEPTMGPYAVPGPPAMRGSVVSIHINHWFVGNYISRQDSEFSSTRPSGPVDFEVEVSYIN